MEVSQISPFLRILPGAEIRLQDSAIEVYEDDIFGDRPYPGKTRGDYEGILLRIRVFRK